MATDRLSAPPRGTTWRQKRQKALPPVWTLARQRPEYLLLPLVLALSVLGWQAMVQVGQYPVFILPTPHRVWLKFLLVLQDGTLWRHAHVTLQEALLGFLTGFVFAAVLGYVLAKSRFLEKLVSPYIVASQSIPIVALAPLLVLWFGTGLISKVLAAFLIVFFPMLVNTVVGIRGVSQEHRELMRSYSASAWQVFVKLELPSALPVFFGGVKVGITLSVIGAVVGEFVGADRGLGFLINFSRGVFDTPLMFVALISLMVMALTLYLSVALLEMMVLRWRRR